VKPIGMPQPEQHAHGTRARYVAARCRCEPCRRANCEYEKARAAARRRGEWNGLVDAAPVRNHLRALSRQGVGYKSVAAAADVSRTTLAKVLDGRRRTIRKASADRVLSVDADAAADGAYIAAGPTWRLLREMRAAGVTYREISERLGRKSRGLQFGHRRIRASSALEVRRLHAEVMREVELEKAAASICHECGQSHAPDDRQRVMVRMLPCTVEEFREAHPCWWVTSPADRAQDRILYRDLHAVGAVKIAGLWTLRGAAAAAGTGVAA
jgi:hypothetical protein